jgi:hypothetical protein
MDDRKLVSQELSKWTREHGKKKKKAAAIPKKRTAFTTIRSAHLLKFKGGRRRMTSCAPV